MLDIRSDGNRLIITEVAFALLGVLAILIGGIWNIATGRAPHPSFILVIILIFSIIGVLRFKATTLRVVFGMAAAQAVVRVALWLTRASAVWQRSAALGGEVVIVLAASVTIFVIVKWLNSAVRGQSPSDREQPAS